MSSRENLLKFLEMHKDDGYSIQELIGELDISESTLRKHVNRLVEEDIIEEITVKGVRYYGFTGFDCELIGECEDACDVCKVFAHRCDKRERMLDEQ